MVWLRYAQYKLPGEHLLRAARRGVLYHSREKQHPAARRLWTPAPATIVLGCGCAGAAEQAGTLLDGLTGLAMGKFAVPNLLSGSGHVVTDNISMCFSNDGSVVSDF